MTFQSGSKQEYMALKKRYDEYVELYKFLNNGSDVGVTPFSEFYWRFTYYIRYEDPTNVGVGNV